MVICLQADTQKFPPAYHVGNGLPCQPPAEFLCFGEGGDFRTPYGYFGYNKSLYLRFQYILYGFNFRKFGHDFSVLSGWK